MKKALGIMLSLVIAASTAATAFAALPETNSTAYVVMEVRSGQVLASKAAHEKRYPASITKILTSAIALEQGDPNDRHTMTYKATHSIEPGSTHIALTEEEVVTVRDLLKATMIESANDAANGLAEYIAGDIDDFPAVMNGKAAEIGAADSNFSNAHGLPEDDHYTTAYDMALITRWALSVDGFRELFGAESYTVPPTNKQPQERNIGTHHLMLVDSAYYYEGTTGGKLGWTSESRHTMVTLCEKNGMELICVVMDSHPQYEKFKDAINLLDYCYENYIISELTLNRFEDTRIPVLNGDGAATSEISFPEQSFFVAHSPQLARADIEAELTVPESYHEGDTIEPSVIFTDDDGNVLLTAPIEWEEEEIEPVPVKEEAAESVFKLVRTSINFDIRWLWIAVPALLVIALIVLLIIRHRNLKRRELRRAERRRMIEVMRSRQMMEIGAASLEVTELRPNEQIIRLNSHHSYKSTSMNRTMNSRPRSTRGRGDYRK